MEEGKRVQLFDGSGELHLRHDAYLGGNEDDIFVCGCQRAECTPEIEVAKRVTHALEESVCCVCEAVHWQTATEACGSIKRAVHEVADLSCSKLVRRIVSQGADVVALVVSLHDMVQIQC